MRIGTYINETFVYETSVAMVNYSGLLLLCSSVFSLSATHNHDPTLVTLPEGKIRGHILKSRKGIDYYAFQEVPYAAPPVGELRFRPPIPHKKWNGVLETKKSRKICHKTDTFFVPDTIQTEDCLYLNVFTPLKPGDSSKAPVGVLVWIHGGGDTGSGLPQIYKPDLFVDYNIVVVIVNFRIGPLGFLTTEDGVIPGNIGLKDQKLALQWVKKNIRLFGGDPERITVSGESTGAAYAGLQLINKLNKGLLKGVILQSGTAICQWSHQDHARFYAFKLGRSLDPTFTSNDSNDLLKLLRSIPAADITNNTVMPEDGKETELVEREGMIWLPVIEDKKAEGAMLTGPFHEDVRTGNINRIPLLIGFTSEEQVLLMSGDPSIPTRRAEYLDKDITNLIRNKYKMTQENKRIAGRKLKQVYTNASRFQDDLPAVVRFYGDESFTTPSTRHAKLQSRYTDVYLYQFSYKGKMGGLLNTEVAGVRGVGHAEELGYLWDAPLSSDGSPDDPEDLVARHRVLTLWSNFVNYLNPTPKKDSSLCNVIWEKVSPSNLVYLDINSTLELKTNPKEYLNWERIVDPYAIPPLVNY